MITKHEINALNLSPTKKDFVQIWNELLDVAGKLSERWDPTSTNESDPGIVLLKALTGIADKLNYNIDKNILEAFMPSAAQEDSMRKLCEMLGYNIKYYQSAKTPVTIRYYNSNPDDDELEAINKGLVLPKFTVITNGDRDISYFTVDDMNTLITRGQSITVNCMEGQLVKCESINDNNLITINQISEDNKYYLPETQIAENGIFIYNATYNSITADGAASISDGDPWTKVDNLNTQVRGKKVFKFGFDSYESRPYIEFPEDYSSLFNEGLFIYYTRTSGINGNISAHTLTQIELPNTAGWDKVSAESFSVDNAFSATSGANVETIKQAYNNFKKTVGTFNTLVTCRDYMNYIYNLIDGNGKPVVSNVLVTDVRNDINRAITICSCDDSGILYKEKPLTSSGTIDVTNTTEEVINHSIRPIFSANQGTWALGDGTLDYMPSLGTAANFIQSTNYKQFDITADGEVDGTRGNYWVIRQNEQEFETNIPCKSTKITTHTSVISQPKPMLNSFDIVLYPFKSYTQIKSFVKDTSAVYDDSFNLVSNGLLTSLLADINDKESNIKTISHNIVTPEKGHLISINNYLKLNAIVSTTSKISEEEGAVIIDCIKTALANAFNMHELDFGEEIPFESIVEVMEKAHSKIKFISLNEPALYTTFSVFEGYDRGKPVVVEYAVASEWLPEKDGTTLSRLNDRKKLALLNKNGLESRSDISSFNTSKAKEIYNKLAVRNILAGRIPLFKYSNTFTSSFYEAPYQTLESVGKEACPDGLLEQQESTYNIFIDDSGNIYTKRKITLSDIDTNVNGGSNSGSSDGTGTGNSSNDASQNTVDEFLKIVAPFSQNNNIIDKDDTDNPITNIQTFSEITTNNDGCITDLTLSEGEFVKFRAPNFITTKTYPAYVNYNLQLAKDLQNGAGSVATAARATSLFDVLNRSDDVRQKVLDYFGEKDKNKGTAGTASAYKKKFVISQKISKYIPAASSGEDVCTGKGNEGNPHIKDETTGKCKYCGVRVFDPVQKGPIKIVVNNEQVSQTDSIETLLSKSGFVKLLNDNFTAYLAWDESDGDKAPSGDVPVPPIQLDFGNNASPFITDLNILTTISQSIEDTIIQSKNKVKSESDPTPILPTACAWTITFEFECVPFDQTSLFEWENFIKTCANSTNDVYKNVLNFKPIEEHGTILWRTYGQSYDVGKYVMDNGEKLLKFAKSYFGLLPSSNVQRGIYLVEYLGTDAIPNSISNNQDYQLKSGEYLFIEYTPATTTEDSTQQQVAPKTEVHGPGTVIKPSGFTAGIMDSDDFKLAGNTPYKNVTFDYDGKVEEKAMFRFAANEQIEIREFAKVELSLNTLANSDTGIYIYKNFANSDLEQRVDKDTGNNVTNNRKYTLKDGEYIFYTDSLKADFAFFGSGTEVTLSGGVTIQESDIIDIATIMDSGINEIPWQYISLADEAKKITFQEYQYVTLGPKDTIKNLAIEGASEDGALVLGEAWTRCRNDDVIEYQVYEAEQSTVLPAIEVTNNDGWEVSSILELAATPSASQQLRYIPDTISTGLRLFSADSGGDGTNETILAPKNLTDGKEAATLKFKTNVACNVGSTQVNIEELYTNVKDEKSFKLKVFKASEPLIVQTRPNKVVPIDQTLIVDWTGESLESRDLLDIWHKVDLDEIKVAHTDKDDETEAIHDNALLLPILTTKDTYGIVCFYLKYNESDISTDSNCRTWIEVIPGTKHRDVQILNIDKNTWIDAPERSGKSDKLLLSAGINCVRFNKSNKIFIKTSADSKGMLYFDDLKLVNCEKLSQELYTNGLNLDQLGYHRITSDDDKLDTDTLVDITNSMCANLYHKSNEIAAEAKTKFEINAKPFIAALPSLNKIQDDTIAWNSINNADKNTLLKMYQNIKNTLELETDLLDKLSAKTVDEQLLLFISQLASKNVTESQLYQELENIKLLIEENVHSMTDGQTITSFKQELDSDLKTTASAAFKETLNVLLREADEEFIKKLNDFVSDLSNIVNNNGISTAKDALNSLLEEYIKNKSRSRELQIVVNELLASANLDEIYNLLDELEAANSAGSHKRVVLLLDQLKSHILSKELQIAVDGLQELMSNELLDVYLNAITGEELDEGLVSAVKHQLKRLKIDGEAEDGEAEEGHGYVVAVISKVIDSKRAQAAKGESINVDAITEKINEVYKTSFDRIVTDIYAMLNVGSEGNEIKDADGIKKLKAALDKLIINNDDALCDLADNIKDAIDDHVTLIELLKKDAEKDLANWEFINNATYIDNFKVAVVPIWQKHLLTVIKQRFTFIEQDIVAAIYADDTAGLLTQVDLTSEGLVTIWKIKNNLYDEYLNSFSELNKKLMAESQLLTLIDTIETMCRTVEKNKAFTGTAENIGSILGVNATFVNKKIEEFSAVDATSKNKTNRIVDLLTELRTYNLTHSQKANLILQLKEELYAAKTLDTQLLDILESQMYPNISKIKSTFNKDSIEYRIADKFNIMLLDKIENAQVCVTDISTCVKAFSLLVDGPLALTSQANGATYNISALWDLMQSQEVLNPIIGYGKSLISAADYAKLEDIYKYFIIIRDADRINKADLVKEFISISDDEYVNIKDKLTYVNNKLTLINNLLTSITEGELNKFLKNLYDYIQKLKNNTLSAVDKKAVSVLALETQLLKDIIRTDIDRDFYYTAPVAPSNTIEVGNNADGKQTLANPVLNYDVNNVNNSFVISKIDIDYLTEGIQIARTSKLTY